MSLMLNRRQAIAVGLGALASLGLPACSCSKKFGFKSTYTIATDTAFTPFEFSDDSGTYVGVDIELLDAIAADQGFEYELKPVGFDTALSEVAAGTYDGVMAGVSITSKRQQTLDFSDPYFEANVCCAASTGGKVTKLEDLKDATVAVKPGTQGAAWAKELASQFDIGVLTEFANSEAMYKSVATGGCVACFEDTPVMAYNIANNSDLALTIIADSGTDSEYARPYGFAVKKGENAELLEKFNTGLANIKADGTYEKILAKYGQTA